MPPQRFHPMGRDARRTSRLFVPLFPVVACTGHSVWWKCRIRLSNGGLSQHGILRFYPVNHLSEHPTVDVQITCVGAGVNVGILNFIKDGLCARQT